MKKSLMLLVVLLGGLPMAFAQNNPKVVVTGDRVSLRALPESDAVLLGRAMMGDELVLKDNSQADWVGVLPPAEVDLWVNRDFVSNQVVSTKLLNIRSGPSMSHSVVGSAMRGDQLVVRGEVAEWLKIAPTDKTVVWINRNYVEVPGDAAVAPPQAVGIPVVSVEPVQGVPVVEPVKETAPVELAQVDVAPVPETVPVAEVPEVVSVPEVLPVADEPAAVTQKKEGATIQEIMSILSPADGKPMSKSQVKPQGLVGSYSGVLMRESEMFSKIVDEQFSDVIVCYVRGNAEQMKTFDGKKLELTGKVYWADGLTVPMIVPSRIKLLSSGR